MRVPMLPVPAPIALPLFSPSRFSSSLLPFSSRSTNILPASANNVDRNTSTATINRERKLEINENASWASQTRNTADKSEMGGGISEPTANVFHKQQQEVEGQQQWLVEDKIATATITEKGLNWTELVIGNGKAEKRDERTRTKAKSAKEKESEGGRRRRRDHRSGRRSRIPFEAHSAFSSLTKANTSQPSNQSRSILVSKNPITDNTSSPTDVAAAAGRTWTTSTRYPATIGRMPKPTSTTTTISAQSVPAPAGFTFYSSIKHGSDQIHRHHHNSKQQHKKLLFLRSPPIEQQQYQHEEQQTGSSRQTQHQRHQHHYHYRDVLLHSPQHLDTNVLPLSPSSSSSSTSSPFQSDDGDDYNEDNDSDYIDDDPGPSNFPSTFHQHVRRKLEASNPKGNKNSNNFNNHMRGSRSKQNKSNVLVQAKSSSEPTHHRTISSSSSLVQRKKKARKTHRHLTVQ